MNFVRLFQFHDQRMILYISFKVDRMNSSSKTNYNQEVILQIMFVSTRNQIRYKYAALEQFADYIFIILIFFGKNINIRY